LLELFETIGNSASHPKSTTPPIEERCDFRKNTG
jgi:hypothetical protein